MPARSSVQPFRVGRSRTGAGLFATDFIKKGTFIIEYWGKRVPTKTADDLNSKYLFEINSRWTVNGSDRRNIARYINHSCRPNAEADIVKGESTSHGRQSSSYRRSWRDRCRARRCAAEAWWRRPRKTFRALRVPLGSNTSRHSGLRRGRSRFRQAMIWGMFGISDQHRRNTSGVHAVC